jgi:hypothetical protein
MMGALSTSETSVYTRLHGAASHKIAILKKNYMYFAQKNEIVITINAI